jgi:hypothetical protein
LVCRRLRQRPCNDHGRGGYLHRIALTFTLTFASAPAVAAAVPRRRGGLNRRDAHRQRLQRQRRVARGQTRIGQAYRRWPHLPEVYRECTIDGRQAGQFREEAAQAGRGTGRHHRLRDA